MRVSRIRSPQLRTAAIVCRISSVKMKVLFLQQTFQAFLISTLPFLAAHGASTLPVEVFDTNRVVALEFKLSEAHWYELRYQHREAEFFPEEGKAPPEDPYTWFPAEVT